MSCLFCGIANGETSATLVFEDEVSVAFLDHRPLFPGHTLLVPRKHFETLSDLPTGLVGPFFCNVQLLARAVELAREAFTAAGLKPYDHVVRGGTDGSRLTELGLPTPNLFCGEHNAHGPLEWVAVQDMESAVTACAHLAALWERKG